MNVLFLTIGRMQSIDAHGIYPDLLREFRDNGHNVYIVSPREKRSGLPTELKNENGATLLYVKIGNITKCGMLEKGISTLTIESNFKSAIKKHFKDIKFDLVMYSTPPITLCGVVNFVKKRDGAKAYLLLKDIFPQNAVDLGLMKKSGIKGLIYKFFRKKEKKLYAVSDYIGCMSPANREYVLAHNPEVMPERVEVCPNSVKPVDMRISDEEKYNMREKYGLPNNKKIFLYGGNLGRPQDVPFIIECLRGCRDIEDSFFVIAGSGTDRHFLEEYVADESPCHVKLLGNLPKEEYDKMVACCDVGLIFLDHRFTIPNYPSRLLAYMQAGLPILACTDANTDIGKIAEENGYGLWCESSDGNEEVFASLVKRMCETEDLLEMGKRAREFLDSEYTVERAYGIIIKHFCT